MKDKKDIKIRNSARFVIMVDEDFDKVSMVDLKNGPTRLNAKDSYEVVKNCFGQFKYIVDNIEVKVKHKEKNELKKNISIIK